jgi:hypothetical protein
MKEGSGAKDAPQTEKELVMKKLLYVVSLGLLVLFSFSACTVSRGVSSSPDSGENWATQRAVRR